MIHFKSLSTALQHSGIPFLNQNGKMLSDVISSVGNLSSLSESQLREASDSLRLRVGKNTSSDKTADIKEAFSLIYEAFRRALGINLYREQLTASLSLLHGRIAEMQTGEGKTFSCAPAAYYHALSGEGVHVATPNHYLACRDCELLQPVFQLLGIRVAVLPEEVIEDQKREAYQSDITYGSAAEFGFDYLRDQLVLHQSDQSSLGKNLLQSLAHKPTSKTMQRGLNYVIIDEADHVLLDDATSPLILSNYRDTESRDVEVYQAALTLAQHLEEGLHYRMNHASGAIALTELGESYIHQEEFQVPLELLNRTWAEYVTLAIRASVLRKNVDYIVDQDQKVQIVDSGSGRIYSDRTWQDGLHQSVEVKENVDVSPEKTTMVQITKQRFFRKYAHVAGMTGTAKGCERELRHVYKLGIDVIPLKEDSKRVILPQRVFVTLEGKRKAIVESVKQLYHLRRPVLLGTLSIEESEQYAKMLKESGIPFQLLNGIQDEGEAGIIAKAGQAATITIATSLAGRGTDIALGDEVAELGGLHVIVSECAESARVDRQLIGRCARQGDPGSAQVFISAEDPLVMQNGAWLVPVLNRYAGEQAEIDIDLTAQIKRLQKSAERYAYRGRCELFRQDLDSESA